VKQLSAVNRLLQKMWNRSSTLSAEDRNQTDRSLLDFWSTPLVEPFDYLNRTSTRHRGRRCLLTAALSVNRDFQKLCSSASGPL